METSFIEMNNQNIHLILKEGNYHMNVLKFLSKYLFNTKNSSSKQSVGS